MKFSPYGLTVYLFIRRSKKSIHYLAQISGLYFLASFNGYLIHTYECTLKVQQMYVKIYLQCWWRFSWLPTCREHNALHQLHYLPLVSPQLRHILRHVQVTSFFCPFSSVTLLSNYNRQSHSFSDSSAQLSVHFFSTQSKAGFLDVARGRRAALSRRPPPSSAPRAG